MANKTEEFNKGEIIIYKPKGGDIEIEVKLDNETIWLTQAQIAFLLGIERNVITKHLRNILKSGELQEKSNLQKKHIPNSDKPVKFYNLDIIIFIGYRVNSQRATQFRIWATKMLKNYFIKGYIIKQQTIDFLRRKSEAKLHMKKHLVKVLGNRVSQVLWQ